VRLAAVSSVPVACLTALFVAAMSSLKVRGRGLVRFSSTRRGWPTVSRLIVRFLPPSSGRQGYAIAAALARGRLLSTSVSGPCRGAAARGVDVVKVETPQIAEGCEEALPDDVFVSLPL